MQIQPYLFFDGRCEEAIEFYRKAIDAELVMRMRAGEAPEPHRPGPLPPGMEEKVLHAALRIGESVVLASDGPFQGSPAFQGFALSLYADDEDECRRWFAALSEGGEVKEPLTPTFFSPCFGMLVDRFGVMWMVLVDAGNAD